MVPRSKLLEKSREVSCVSFANSGLIVPVKRLLLKSIMELMLVSLLNSSGIEPRVRVNVRVRVKLMVRVRVRVRVRVKVRVTVTVTVTVSVTTRLQSRCFYLRGSYSPNETAEVS